MKSKTINKISINKKYNNLIKSHKKLIIQPNFRNNQNYVLTDYGKFKFYNKYFNKRKLAKKYFSYFTIIFWLFLSFVIILKVNNISGYNFEYYLPGILIGTIYFLVIGVILYGIYYFIKGKILYHTYNKFISDKFIFRKRIRKELKYYNKSDFISFKK